MTRNSNVKAVDVGVGASRTLESDICFFNFRHPDQRVLPAVRRQSQLHQYGGHGECMFVVGLKFQAIHVSYFNVRSSEKYLGYPLHSFSSSSWNEMPLDLISVTLNITININITHDAARLISTNLEAALKAPSWKC